MSNTQKIIETLEAKKAAINDDIKLLDDKNANQLKAKKLLKVNSDNSRKRKSDDRKKFIIGAVVLKEMQRNSNFNIQMLEFLKSKVTSDRDRLVLGLEDSQQTNKQINKLTNKFCV